MLNYIVNLDSINKYLNTYFTLPLLSIISLSNFGLTYTNGASNGNFSEKTLIILF